MSRILVVEHQPSCPPALLGEWLRDAGVDLVVTRPWAGDALLDPLAHDALLVLGGSMNAFSDDAHYPWLAPVKQQLRDAVTDGLPTLGVCLGHQLLAVALGGEVGTNPGGQAVGLREVGWTEAATGDELFGGLAGGVGRRTTPTRGIHWNDDIALRLPGSAVVLAATADGAPQVVRYAERAWGVQLHPEATMVEVLAWAEPDLGRHVERGLDQAALIAEVAAAREELTETWRPLAAAFAQLARECSELPTEL